MVQTANVSVSAAATSSVTEASVADGASAQIIHEKTRGQETMLAEEEESKLAAYFINIRKQGYARNKDIIIFMATQMAVKRGKTVIGGCLSEKWWKGFLKRNPLTSPQSSQNCDVAQKMETVVLFYKGLQKCLTNSEYGSLVGKPYLVFSADENGFDFDSVNKVATGASGSKHGPKIPKRQREQVTVLSCISAFGESIPSMFVLKSRSGLVSYGTQGDSPGADVLFSPQKLGWTDNDLYLRWFREVFLPSIPAERPALLLVDGQKAHVTADFTEEAKANKVILVCRPAQFAHLVQPLNLSLNGPLRKGLTKAIGKFLDHPSGVVDKHNFAKIYNMAWYMTITPEVIRDGFRRAGIYPLNPQAFDYSKLLPKNAFSTKSL